MTRTCAWCGLVLGVKEPFDQKGITHGICLSCGTAMLTWSEPAGSSATGSPHPSGTRHSRETLGRLEQPPLG